MTLGATKDLAVMVSHGTNDVSSDAGPIGGDLSQAWWCGSMAESLSISNTTVNSPAGSSLTAAHSDDSHSPYCIKPRLLYIFPPTRLLVLQRLVVHLVHGLIENYLWRLCPPQFQYAPSSRSFSPRLHSSQSQSESELWALWTELRQICSSLDMTM